MLGAGLEAVGRGGTDGFGLAVTGFVGAGEVVVDFDTIGLTGDGVLDLGRVEEAGEGATLPDFCGVREGDDEVGLGPFFNNSGLGAILGFSGAEVVGAATAGVAEGSVASV
jgi:hypothetical protein